MISALRQAGSATALRIEWLRVVMTCLLLVSGAICSVQLFIIEHWLDSFASLIPFILTEPGLFVTG